MDGGGSSNLTLPRSFVSKAIRSSLPVSVKCSEDMRGIIADLLTRYIETVGRESNSLSIRDGKKTISLYHVCQALENLGASEYASVAESRVDADSSHTSSNSKQRGKRKKDPSGLGMSVEELAAMQAKLFAQARSSLIDGNAELEKSQVPK